MKKHNDRMNSRSISWVFVLLILSTLFAGNIDMGNVRAQSGDAITLFDSKAPSDQNKFITSDGANPSVDDLEVKIFVDQNASSSHPTIIRISITNGNSSIHPIGLVRLSLPEIINNMDLNVGYDDIKVFGYDTNSQASLMEIDTTNVEKAKKVVSQIVTLVPGVGIYKNIRDWGAAIKCQNDYTSKDLEKATGFSQEGTYDTITAMWDANNILYSQIDILIPVSVPATEFVAGIGNQGISLNIILDNSEATTWFKKVYWLVDKIGGAVAQDVAPVRGTPEGPDVTILNTISGTNRGSPSTLYLGGQYLARGDIGIIVQIIDPPSGLDNGAQSALQIYYGSKSSSPGFYDGVVSVAIPETLDVLPDDGEIYGYKDTGDFETRLFLERNVTCGLDMDFLKESILTWATLGLDKGAQEVYERAIEPFLVGLRIGGIIANPNRLTGSTKYENLNDYDTYDVPWHDYEPWDKIGRVKILLPLRQDKAEVARELSKKGFAILINIDLCVTECPNRDYVVIDNIGEGVAPAVNWIYPNDGQSVPKNSMVNLMVNAQDNVMIDHVAFELLDEKTNPLTRTPIGDDSYGADGWEVSWDTTGLEVGDYLLNAVATDLSGNTRQNAINIAVSNTYSISGSVAENGSGLGGVSLSCGTSNAPTNQYGDYQILNVANGFCSLTASKAGYSFTPSSIPITVNGGSITNQVFTAIADTPPPAPYTVEITTGIEDWTNFNDWFNYGSLFIEDDGGSSHSQHYESLLRFTNFSSIPANAYINNAELWLHLNYMRGATTEKAEVREMLSPWPIGAVPPDPYIVSGVVLNKQTYSGSGAVDTWIKFNLTNIVKTWRSGGTNRGVLVVPENQFPDYNIDSMFDSTKTSNGSSYRPKLVVSYGYPDLVAGQAKPGNGAAAPPFCTGQQVDWYTATTNIGNVPAENVRIGYYLGNSPTDYTNRIGTDTTFVISANGGTEQSDKTSPLNDPGIKYLNIWVNYNDAIPELNKNNNKISYGPFTVRNCNTAPVVSGIPDLVLNEDSSSNNAIDLWAYVSDAESSDSSLMYVIKNALNITAAGVSIDGNRYIDIHLGLNWNGYVDVEIKVYDVQGLSGSDTFRVTVNPVNDPPWISPSIPAQTALANQPITIDLTPNEHDAEDSGANLDWSVTGLDNVTVTGQNSDDDVLIFTPAVDFSGSDVITLHLHDSEILEATQDVTLTWHHALVISGYVRTAGGIGIGGVSMNGLPGTSAPLTDSNGFYSGTVPAGWSGTVVPQKSSFSFNPPSFPYNAVLADQTNQTYVGASNNAPNMPNDPAPSQNAPIVFVTQVLSWAGGDPNVGDTVKYDVWLKEEGAASYSKTCSNLIFTVCNPAGNFKYGQKYYWYVDAIDNYGAISSNSGSPWSFTTIIAPSTASQRIVSVGGGHTCSLQTDGGIVCWGANGDGQTVVPALPAGLYYSQVSVGDRHACGLRSDGNLFCWGDDGYGQSTVQLLPVGLTYTQVSAGFFHTCAIRSNGSLACWGYNSSGQSNVPALPNGLTYTQVSVGEEHTCALRSNRSLICWGYNYYDQTNVPTLSNGLTYLRVSAGAFHTCGLLSNGSLICWGSHNSGETSVPELPAGLIYSQVSSGYMDTCALRSDGHAVCWGNNGYGRTEIPALPAGLVYTHISATEHTCALRSDDNLVCWGHNSDAQTDVPAVTGPVVYGSYIPRPAPFAKSSPVQGVTGQANSLMLGWQASSDAAYYEYCFDSSNDNTCSQWIKSGSFFVPYTSKWISGLSPNLTYYWQVRAANKGGFTYANGSGTSFWSFKTSALPAPFGKSSPVNFSTKQPAALLLKWGASSGAASYEYCFDKVANGVCDSIWTKSSSTSIFVAGLDNDTTYYWQVRAINPAGGVYANGNAWWKFKTQYPSPLLRTPANGAPLPNRRPTFDWDDVAGATSYTIQMSTFSTFASLTVNATTANSNYTPTLDLPSGKSIYWRVRANGVNGPSAWSQSFWIATANPPSVPVLLSPANNYLTADSTPRLDWSNSTIPLGTFFDHYQLQISADSLFTNIVLDRDVEGAIYSELSPESSLVSNTRFYWRVRSYNTIGQYSAWSSMRYFRTAILSPTLIYPANNLSVPTMKPVFNWDDVPGVTSYTIQVSKYSNFSLLLISTTIAPSTYTPATNLPLNVDLYWRVRSNGTNGPSLWSPVWKMRIDLFQSYKDGYFGPAYGMKGEPMAGLGLYGRPGEVAIQSNRKIGVVGVNDTSTTCACA